MNSSRARWSERFKIWARGVWDFLGRFDDIRGRLAAFWFLLVTLGGALFLVAYWAREVGYLWIALLLLGSLAIIVGATAGIHQFVNGRRSGPRIDQASSPIDFEPRPRIIVPEESGHGFPAPAPPLDPGPELPGRELTEEEREFLFAPTDRPNEPITAGIDALPDPTLSLALGRARRAAEAVRSLLEEVQLPPLDALRDAKKMAIWTLQQEQATLGRYMNQLHSHVLVAVDGLRPYASHDELDRLYRNPRNTGDLRMIAKLLETVADVATPPP